jgi:hypothetical protein
MSLCGMQPGLNINKLLLFIPCGQLFPLGDRNLVYVKSANALRHHLLPVVNEPIVNVKVLVSFVILWKMLHLRPKVLDLSIFTFDVPLLELVKIHFINALSSDVPVLLLILREFLANFLCRLASLLLLVALAALGLASLTQARHGVTLLVAANVIILFLVISIERDVMFKCLICGHDLLYFLKVIYQLGVAVWHRVGEGHGVARVLPPEGVAKREA